MRPSFTLSVWLIGQALRADDHSHIAKADIIMRSPVWRSLVLPGLVPLLVGCARSSVVTDIKPDGTWSRSLKFVGTPDEGTKGKMNMAPKLREVFDLPEGDGWKNTIKKGDGEVTFTAERSFSKTDSFQNDVVVKSLKPDSPRLLTNQVSVHEVSPGRLEYREVLHWRGDRPKELDALLPEIAATVKAALPPDIATDDAARDVALKGAHSFWRILLGPGDPLISEGFMHPDLAERKMRRQMGIAATKALLDRFGDRLSADARLAATRKIVSTLTEEGSTLQKTAANTGTPKQDNDGTALTPLLFTVRLPGRIVSSNGEVDETANEVYWALYAGAAAMEDVTLTATCDVMKQAAR